MRVEKIKGSILTARPEGMGYETYRAARKEQQERLKRRLRGFMVWPSKGIFGQKDHEGKFIPVQSKGTLVGKVPSVEFI